MDVLTFTFCFLLLLAGAMLTVVVSKGTGRKIQHRWKEPDSARHQYMKELRRMERRRARIWWRMDELHAEFVARDAARAAELPPADETRPAGRRGPSPDGDVTPEDIRDAFEKFLRRS